MSRIKFVGEANGKAGIRPIQADSRFLCALRPSIWQVTRLSGQPTPLWLLGETCRDKQGPRRRYTRSGADFGVTESEIGSRPRFRLAVAPREALPGTQRAYFP